ncbi:putative synaptotagmin-1 [Triplophysa rosa]|uniref:Synaptotagmin-1 n=1 Tax=Triplophysa rosa TaxID=992332 RepID=A0A9W7WJT3_TRIRA|nr:putative synaptotagmin-1 [Triplophysa rosa]
MIDFSTQGLSFGEIQLLFSEEIEYCILGVSATIFLVVLCLLIWQIYRYCTTLSVSQRAGDRRFVGQKWRFSVCYTNKRNQGETHLKKHLYIQHAQGSLRFSLFYDKLQSRLVVTVLDAQYLAVRDFSRSVDPFVWVRLLSLQCVLHEWQTRLVKKSCSPVFGDQFSCTLDEEEVSRVTVRFEVRDYDKYSRYGILGEARVSLNCLKISYPLELRYNLHVPKKDMVGEVLLSLKYMPTSQRLEVGVLKIRTVSHPTKTERVLYAKASVICNQCKLRHQRTAQRKRWEMTVFNEVLTFLLPDPQISECSIIVAVYELHPAQKSSRRLIGQIHLEKGRTSENEHWKLMMQSLRQPIAKWHFILI